MNYIKIVKHITYHSLPWKWPLLIWLLAIPGNIASNKKQVKFYPARLYWNVRKVRYLLWSWIILFHNWKFTTNYIYFCYSKINYHLTQKFPTKKISLSYRIRFQIPKIILAIFLNEQVFQWAGIIYMG